MWLSGCLRAFTNAPRAVYAEVYARRVSEDPDETPPNAQALMYAPISALKLVGRTTVQLRVFLRCSISLPGSSGRSVKVTGIKV